MHFIKKLLEKLHLTYKGRSIFTKFYWSTWLDRRRNGFDITDTWNLDYTFAKFMVPRLLAFTYCLTDKKYSTGVPKVVFDDIVYQYKQKKYAFDEKNNVFKNQDINDEVFNKAQDRWFNIVNTITAGFQDFLMEDKNYNEWEQAWTETLKEIEEGVSKCKGKVQKIKFLDQYKVSYFDYKDGKVDIYYLSNALRKKSLQYLSKYFYELWW